MVQQEAEQQLRDRQTHMKNKREKIKLRGRTEELRLQQQHFNNKGYENK